MNRSREAAAARSRSGWLWVPSCLALAVGLAGCNANPGSVAASTTAAVHVTARPGVSPSGATVAIASVEGAPAEVARRYAERTRDQAAGLDVVMTDVRSAKYLVRSYLSAETGPGGAEIAYVLDVFDARKARVQRVADAVAVKGGGGDPWSGVDDKVLGELAARTAADLAVILSNMPEAVAASRAGPSAGDGQTRAPAGAVATAAFQ